MERSASSLVINGDLEVKLPVGYRFHPTDEELVVHYLRRKVFDLPLPASVIPDLDVFQTHPWSLPGDLKEKRYFFSRRERNNNGKVKKRRRVKTNEISGYWKPIGKERKIVDSVSNEVIGLRKSLVFCQYSTTQFESSTNTKWVMHEYSLFRNQISEKALMEETWVVHSLFQKKRKPKRHGHTHGVCRSYIHDEVIDRQSFMVEADDHEGPPQPASPCFSEVTHEISSSGYLSAHEQEESSTSTTTTTGNYNISFCSSFSRMRNKH